VGLQADVAYQIPQYYELQKELSSEARPVVEVSDPGVIMQGVGNFAVLLF